MKRILEISKKLGLSHVGSSLTAYPIIEEIYKIKKPDEKFVLSNGHAHLAHLVVMNPDTAEKMIQEYGIHCNREAGCDVSSGSLGNGIAISVGMALADRSKNVFCMISDGECAEGIVFEALRIAQEQNLTNLKVYCAANGWASYQAVDLDVLEKRLQAFFPVDFRRTTQEEPFTGQKAHYVKVS